MRIRNPKEITNPGGPSRAPVVKALYLSMREASKPTGPKGPLGPRTARLVPAGAHNTPDSAHGSVTGWWRSWGLGVCGSGPGGFQVELGQLRAKSQVPPPPGVCRAMGRPLVA